MQTTRTILLVASVLLLSLSGCASVGASGGMVTKAKMIPTEIPMPIKTIQVWDPNQKKRVEVDVLSLKPSDIRGRLTSTETFITVEKRDSSGSLTYMGAGGKVSRGTYRVTFDYTNYTTEDISFADPAEGTTTGTIGVGLRITADLQTLASSVDLSGPIPIGLAAQDKKVIGQLRFYVYGMSNDKIALSVPTQAILDVNAIQKCFEAAATARILFGLPETKLEPYLIGVADVRPVDAKRAIEAATTKLTK